MTDGLVKRLRAVSLDLGVPSTTRLDSDVIRQAADLIEELEERLKAATDDAKEAEAYAEELEATLKKLEYWLDTDQEILDVMGNNERADHMRKLKMIRDALKGDSDDT